VPHEGEAAGDIERAIERAVAEAELQGIRGKAVTPFLLKRVSELSGGASQRTNQALLVNNARTAALVALELAGIRR
jgi:pseudouridine-5'-phosphate glycosidase